MKMYSVILLKDLDKELDVLYCEKEVEEKEKEGVKILLLERVVEENIMILN